MSAARHPRREPPAGEREPGEERERLKLSDAASTLVEECRMVLPGIQAIFGFQLIAVFNQRFSEDLSGFEQRLHLAGIFLLALAAALVMVPAAIHRHYGGREVTDTFVRASSVLLLTAMVPLAMGLAIDFFILGRLVLGEANGLAIAFAAGVFCMLIFLWMVFPRMQRLQELIGRLPRGRQA